MDQHELDARRQLDETYENPPEPFNFGCTRTSLNAVFRTMQFLGMFFDGHHYKTVRQMVEERIQESGQLTNINQRKNNKISVMDLDSVNISNGRPSGDVLGVVNTSTTTNVEKCGDKTNQNQWVLSDNYVHRLVRIDTGIIDEEELRDLLCPWNNIRNSKQAFNKDGGKKITPPKKWRLSVSSFFRTLVSFRMYNILVTGLLWANLARCVIYIGDPRLDFMTSVPPFLWFLLCSLNATIIMISCWKKSHFSAFFVNWTLLYKDMTSRRLGLRGNDSQASFKYYVMTLIFLIVTNFSSNIYIMLSEDSVSNGANNFIYIDGQRSLRTIVLSSVINLFCVFSWLCPFILIVALCRHIVAHFNQFKSVFKLHILAAGNGFPAHFSELRERHLVMCNLTAILDRYMSVAFAAIYSNKITTACFILYQIINLPWDSTLITISFFWIGSSVLVVGVITYQASNVHVALQLFLSKVNGPDLGFTVLGLITVKRELMLTLFGLYITYGVVLLQFK